MISLLQRSNSEIKMQAKKFAICSLFAICIATFGIWAVYFNMQFNDVIDKNTKNAIISIDSFFDQAAEIAKEVTPLIEKNCDMAEETLRIKALTFVAIRSINLAKDNIIYCSSVLSNIHEKITDQSILAIENGSIIAKNTPIITFRDMNLNRGVVITMYAQFIASELISNKKSENDGDYLITIGNKLNKETPNLFLNGVLISPDKIEKNYLKSKSVSSTKYPYSVLNGQTKKNLYKSLSTQYVELFVVLLSSIILSLLSGVLYYQYRLRKTMRAIKNALKEGEIQPYLQPIIDVQTGQWSGAEVLARWYNPVTSKYIPPDVFIPIAERSHLINVITSSFMDTVANTLNDMKNILPNGFKISFNISAQNCDDPNLFTDCEKFLHHFPNGEVKLSLELTERDMIHPSAKILNLFDRLSALNISFILDDFGTKNSNLAYFESFKVSAFKIDRSFTSKLQFNDTMRKIVDNMISLSQTFNIPIIAEGIENTFEKNYFASRGITLHQGFLYAKPMSLDDFKKNLKNNV